MPDQYALAKAIATATAKLMMNVHAEGEYVGGLVIHALLVTPGLSLGTTGASIPASSRMAWAVEVDDRVGLSEEQLYDALVKFIVGLRDTRNATNRERNAAPIRELRLVKKETPDGE